MRGFTLVETLIVLALLVLGATVLLPSAGAIFRRARFANPEEEVNAILQQARREAVLSGREIVMRFDPKAQRFVWNETGGANLAGGDAHLEVSFLRPDSGSSVLIGGRLIETAQQPAMKFFPDGTCEPVRLQLRVANSAARVITIDPWTCAPGLEAKS
jgi:type II secretion system protein H